MTITDSDRCSHVQFSYRSFFSFFTSLSLADNRPSKLAECYLVVDVSGSMYRYADVVKPVLRKQVDSMQDGDKVSIVRFGTYTKIREEECGQISPVFQAELNLIIEKIYEGNGTLLSNTDLGEMLTALLRYMELSSAINKKIVLISDFVNDVPVKELVRYHLIIYQNGIVNFLV